MDPYMECPLHWIVTTDEHYGQLEARLRDPDERNIEGNTLLHVAAQSPKENSRIVRLLIERGADVNSSNENRNKPLHLAVSSRNRQNVDALIKAGACINSKDVFDRTALHFAVCNKYSYRVVPVPVMACDMRIVGRLLCHPEIDVKAVDRLGESPLLWSVRERNLDAVRALLRKGADPNIPNIGNLTPLHVALSSPRAALPPKADIAIALLENGAGIHSLDNSQRTPVDILLRNVHDVSMFAFASRCVMILAFRCHPRESLKSKLRRIPDLHNYFIACCEEVALMKRLIIYGNFNLLDFSLGRFPKELGDAVCDIYTPVVEMLISLEFTMYYEFIFRRLSKLNLRRVLESVAGPSALELIPDGASKESLFDIIRDVYNHNDELNRRLLGWNHLL